MARRRRWGAGIGLVVGSAMTLAGCGGSSPPRTPRLTVTPRAGLVDRARAITVSGLDRGEHVTLLARTLIEGSTWTSRTVYAADRSGRVDVSTAAPVSGAYHRPSVLGPIWSESEQIRRSTANRTGDAATPAITTTLTATTGRGRSTPVAVSESFRGPGVHGHVTTLRHQGFVGEYFTPAGHSDRRPAMILWGGSEGGDSGIPDAALLASHGIPALAIAYFDEPGLPCSLSDIPIEYFVRAIRWLKRQPGVDPERVWAWGVSRGSEPLGLVAEHWPGLLHGLVDESGSAVVNESFRGHCTPPSLASWTLRGHQVPFDEQFGATGLQPTWARGHLISFAAFRGPVLLVSGADDELWPSDRYEDIIMRELRHDPAPHVHLNYAQAGHADLGPPYTPVLLSADDHGIIVHLGGTAAGYEQARLQDWPTLLRFVADH